MNIHSFLTAGLIGASIIVVEAQLAPAQAFTLVPNNVSNNGSTNVASNFSINVVQENGKAKFTFTNVQNVAEATITAIYFGTKNNLGSFLSFDSIQQSGWDQQSKTGVQFSEGATPNNPGGSIDWEAAFASDADSPAGYQKKGVDVGESISFLFNFVGTKTLSDVETAFNSGDLAIAFHAQSIGGDNGYSDWFATEDVTSEDIPEPLTLLGTGAAIGFGTLFQKRRAQLKKEQA